MSGLYRPSNGSEGEWFMSQWCARCENDRLHREGGDHCDACPIATWTMAVPVSDLNYPKEWRYDGAGHPCCTAFRLTGESALSPIDQHLQLSLFAPATSKIEAVG